MADHPNVFELVGQSLSDRIARLWQWLSEAEREEVRAQTTEDGMRALLDRLEQPTVK